MDRRQTRRIPQMDFALAILPGIAGLTMLLAACATADAPSGLRQAPSAPLATNAEHEHDAANGDVKAFIGGWLDGKQVRLRYTREYYCDEPRGASPSSYCELGTPPVDFARPGEMPILYALSPVGISPDPATVHCPGGVVCPNHPATIDVPPLGDAWTNVSAPAHSHLLTERTAGWHRTVSIRVTSLDVWNQIVANPTLATVRALQANPLYGGAQPALISQDIPTNIFFFIEIPDAGSD